MVIAPNSRIKRLILTPLAAGPLQLLINLLEDPLLSPFEAHLQNYFPQQFRNGNGERERERWSYANFAPAASVASKSGRKLEEKMFAFPSLLPAPFLSPFLLLCQGRRKEGRRGRERHRMLKLFLQRCNISNPIYDFLPETLPLTAPFQPKMPSL